MENKTENKTEIIVNVNVERVKVTTETVSVELPTESKFYMMNDDGNFFPRGIVLFAILIKHKSNFMLYEVENGKQFSTDFVPTSDCKSEYWMKDSNSIRRTAFDIMRGKNYEFKEITKEDFLSKRTLLLDERLMEYLTK